MSGLKRLENRFNVFQNECLEEGILRFENFVKEAKAFTSNLPDGDLNKLSVIDLSLIEFRMERVKTFSAPILRLESNLPLATKIELRLEGFLETIWNKIVSFWEWLVDKIKEFFSSSKDKAEEQAKATKEIKEELLKKKSKAEATTDGKPKHNSMPFKHLFGIEKTTGMESIDSVKKNLKSVEEARKTLFDLAAVSIEEIQQIFNRADKGLYTYELFEDLNNTLNNIKRIKGSANGGVVRELEVGPFTKLQFVVDKNSIRINKQQEEADPAKTPLTLEFNDIMAISDIINSFVSRQREHNDILNKAKEVQRLIEKTDISKTKQSKENVGFIMDTSRYYSDLIKCMMFIDTKMLDLNTSNMKLVLDSSKLI